MLVPVWGDDHPGERLNVCGVLAVGFSAKYSRRRRFRANFLLRDMKVIFFEIVGIGAKS